MGKNYKDFLSENMIYSDYEALDEGMLRSAGQWVGSKLSSIGAYKELPNNVDDLSNLVCDFIHKGNGKFIKPKNDSAYISESISGSGLFKGTKISITHRNSAVYVITANFGDSALESAFRRKFKFDVSDEYKHITLSIFYPFDISKLLKDKNNFPKNGKDLQKYILSITIGNELDRDTLDDMLRKYISTKKVQRVI